MIFTVDFDLLPIQGLDYLYAEGHWYGYDDLYISEPQYQELNDLYNYGDIAPYGNHEIAILDSRHIMIITNNDRFVVRPKVMPSHGKRKRFRIE